MVDDPIVHMPKNVRYVAAAILLLGAGTEVSPQIN